MNHLQKLNFPSLILPPAFAVYRGETDEYRGKVSETITILARHLPKPQMFLTDETAQTIRLDCVEWVQPVPDEDMLFIRRNCRNMGFSPPYAVKDTALHNTLRSKFPIPRGLAPEARLSIAIKRNNAAICKLKKAYRTFVVFQTAAVSGIPDAAFLFKIDREFSRLELFQSGFRLDTRAALGEDIKLPCA